MNNPTPEKIGIIAGRGNYPCLLAQSAKAQGVKEIYTVAFKGETSRKMNQLADHIDWQSVGELQKFLDHLHQSGVKHAVMAGQIAPRNLFTLRMDKAMRTMLSGLKERNADSLFGAIADQLQQINIRLLPASAFMEKHMPPPGTLTHRNPTPVEHEDIQLGKRVLSEMTRLNVGQTVVVKQGTVLAVEAFEGTDKTIRRAGKVGHRGGVVVKMAGRGHDIRFDIPVIGTRTLRSMKKAGITCLAVEANRTIFLGLEELTQKLNAMNIATIAFTNEITNPS